MRSNRTRGSIAPATSLQRPTQGCSLPCFWRFDWLHCGKRRFASVVRKSLCLFLGYFVFALLFVSLSGQLGAQNWRTASREPAGLAPDRTTTHKAVAQVYATRAVSWRGCFGVHTCIAVKPTDAGRFNVKDYLELSLVAKIPSGTGGQFNLLGVADLLAGSEEGVEIDLAEMIFGVDPKHVALKLPFMENLGVGGRVTPRTVEPPVASAGP